MTGVTATTVPVRTADLLRDGASRDGNAITFRVTDDMVTRFAALTGDCSSLHVSDDFARKSAYRRPVVHGMLPVGFLALLPALRGLSAFCLPIAITGRFVAPVRAGDELTLRAGEGRAGSNEGEVVFDFEIQASDTGAAVTLGTLTVLCESAREHESGAFVSGRAGTLAEPLAVKSFTLEEIQKGMTDRIDFSMPEEAIAEFLNLLASGIGDHAGDMVSGLADRVHLPNLLAVLLFSTSVGVSLPGATATFLEFSARIERRLEAGAAYSLEGEVVHRSAGTRIVKKDLRVSPNGAGSPVLTGRVAALVAKPSRKMPSIEELRRSATDWGLEGKVVLITGASRGIGETTAKLLGLFGAKVIVNYHRGAADATRVVDEIVAAGGEAFAIGADVTRPDEVSALVRGGLQHFGAVDVLVNNAVRDFRPIPFEQLTWDEVQQDLDVIAKGAFLCCQQVIPVMLEQGGGKIVNIASVAVDDPPANQTKYVMAKSALVGLTRSLSIEYASRNIQVNMVVPNFVETDLVAHVAEGFQRRIARDTPMGRNATPADVARAVLFLASAHSSFTTGQKLMVTGGGAPYL